MGAYINIGTKMPVSKKILLCAIGFLAFNANAWMKEWAPAFKCTPARVEELPDTNVSNFVSTVHSEDLDRADFYWQYCKGYKLDLNGDGIKDFVYILPWMGCGLAAQGYDAHFRVSAGANGWADTVIEGHDISKVDLVNVAGNIYFRHSDIFWHFEKSKHNHWVYQIFSFGKNGDMICSNSEFGNLFPAVTIYYIKPKFKQIELTSNDLKGIEDWTRRKIHLPGRNTKKPNENFDLLNYRALWNDDAEKAKMVINPVSKKKEANDWKPPRKLTEAQCTKLMRIMTDRFGEPAKCRTGYASFVYVWRFEGDEWLSVGVSTMANMGGDPIAIHHWEWRKPELSVYDEEEAKARRFPIVQIDKEGLPPAAFFEFFNPYPSVKDGETEKNLITEFNVTKYLEESGYTRCTAEWDAVDRRYDIYTAHPDEWRCEFDTCKGGPNGGHTNEYHVGVVQFYKLASDLYMCYSMFCQDGTMGPDRVRYLFEVYDRDVWSVDSNKPIKSKLVRYIGAVPIDEVPKFREEWVRKHVSAKSVAQFSEDSAELPGTLCGEAPKEPELLDTLGNFALYSGESAADVASNKMRHNGDCPYHNSLFLRRRKADGTDEWRVLLTTGSNWREAAGMSEWCASQSSWLKDHFYIKRAKFGLDRHHLWLVCNTHIPLWNVACSYDVQTDEFRALIDGDTADEQPDGTILVKGKKTYLSDENGEPLGARWYDAWLKPNGEIVRKGKLMTIEEMMEGAEFVPKEEEKNGH